MSHCITKDLPILYSKNYQLPLHRIPAATDNIVYLLEYKPGYVAAVDGPSHSEVLAYCRENSLKLTHILNTHTHGDHIGINLGLKKDGTLESIEVFGSDVKAKLIPGLTQSFRDGDAFRLGKHQVKVWLTEGHIDGHISFIIDNFLFCGDTLFTGGCGYLFDGPPVKMHRSLSRIGTLDPNTLICCAHEYTVDNLWFALSLEPQNISLLKRLRETKRECSEGGTVVPSPLWLEKKTNPFLRCDESSIISAIQQLYPDRKFETESQIFAAMREAKNRKWYRENPIPDL